MGDTEIEVRKSGAEPKWFDVDPNWEDDDPSFDPYTEPPYEPGALAASGAIAELRDVPRDAEGKWTKGPAGARLIPPPPGRPGGAGPKQPPPGVLKDVDFEDVQIAYRPRHPDGKADPGEIVWAKIPFEEDPTRSKDRPVLIIGRTADGKNLVGVQLTSKPGAGRPSAGSGAWDPQGRESFLKLDRFVQIDDVNYRREGAYMKKPDFQNVVDDLTERQKAPKVTLRSRVFRLARSVARPATLKVEEGGADG